MDKFRDICRHWVALDEVRDPVSMYHGLEQQKQRISKLMLQKDAIIDECRKELIVADENYYRNQAKQSEDLQCLVERINEHVETMKRAYRQQLERLQKTIADERNRMTQETDTAWTDLFDQKRIHENEKLDEQKNQLMANDRELEALVLSHEELIRTTKCRLESDNDCLQLELQKTKADVLLNTQKLDYNFEVLKRREEESVRNQQKKRLTKQHVEHVDEIGWRTGSMYGEKIYIYFAFSAFATDPKGDGRDVWQGDTKLAGEYYKDQGTDSGFAAIGDGNF